MTYVWVIESRSATFDRHWSMATYPPGQMCFSGTADAECRLEFLIRTSDGTIKYRIRKYVRLP
jgi:hypothetical protein